MTAQQLREKAQVTHIVADEKLENLRNMLDETKRLRQIMRAKNSDQAISNYANARDGLFESISIDDLDGLVSELARTRIAIEAAQRDAERYRWLRETNNPVEKTILVRYYGDVYVKAIDELDAAIDAALNPAREDVK